LPGLLYIGGWVLMTAAMMLPTVLPLLERFERLTAARADRRLLVGLLIAGYLLVWAVFGFAAHTALHLIARQSTWLAVNGWMLGAIVLATAGAFQFTRLKYRCLDRCRTPFSFIAQYWRGRRPKWNAFVLGGHHGAFCVGMLLGDHAADVCRRHRQCRVHAGTWCNHGVGKKRALGAAAELPARLRLVELGGNRDSNQHCLVPQHLSPAGCVAAEVSWSDRL
jgi:hypothetical protein